MDPQSFTGPASSESVPGELESLSGFAFVRQIGTRYIRIVGDDWIIRGCYGKLRENVDAETAGVSYELRN